MVSTSSRASIPFQPIRTAEDDFDDMVQWITSRATLALLLHEVEQEQLERSREMNRKLLQDHIRQRGDGDSGPKLDVQKEGNVLTLARGRVRSRQIRSFFGVVEAERRGYRAETHCSVYPLDEKLVLFGRSYSYAVQRWTVTAAVLGPFDEAIASVRERTGLTISKRTAEELVVEAAQDFDSFYDQRKPEPPESSGSIIVCSADCKGIPMKKPESAVQGIRQSATKRGVAGAKKKVVDGATKYFYRNRASMRYDEYLAKGLPIASGAVEGSCKNLINDRMERSGMRWVERSAEAMLQLRAIYLSGDFEDYWIYHLAKERERYLAVRAQPCG